MEWSIKRAYDGDGGWIPCGGVPEEADSSATFASRAAAIQETFRRNSCETVIIRAEDIVVGFKNDANTGSVFFLAGHLQTKCRKGWVLRKGIPVEAKTRDIDFVKRFGVTQGNTHYSIHRMLPEGVFLACDDYECFDLERLPDNVRLVDGHSELTCSETKHLEEEVPSTTVRSTDHSKTSDETGQQEAAHVSQGEVKRTKWVIGIVGN